MRFEPDEISTQHARLGSAACVVRCRCRRPPLRSLDLLIVNLEQSDCVVCPTFRLVRNYCDPVQTLVSDDHCDEGRGSALFRTPIRSARWRASIGRAAQILHGYFVKHTDGKQRRERRETQFAREQRLQLRDRYPDKISSRWSGSGALVEATPARASLHKAVVALCAEPLAVRAVKQRHHPIATFVPTRACFWKSSSPNCRLSRTFLRSRTKPPLEPSNGPFTAARPIAS